MNHITDPFTGRPDPACICAACVMRAVRRVLDAEEQALERQALTRLLKDMRAHRSGRGHRDYATCQRLREFFP